MGEYDLLGMLGMQSGMYSTHLGKLQNQQYNGNLQALLGNQQQNSQLQCMLGSQNLFRQGLRYYGQSSWTDEEKAALAKMQMEQRKKETADFIDMHFKNNTYEVCSNEWYLREWDIEFIEVMDWKPSYYLEKLIQCKIQTTSPSTSIAQLAPIALDQLKNPMPLE